MLISLDILSSLAVHDHLVGLRLVVLLLRTFSPRQTQTAIDLWGSPHVGLSSGGAISGVFADIVSSAAQDYWASRPIPSYPLTDPSMADFSFPSLRRTRSRLTLLTAALHTRRLIEGKECCTRSITIIGHDTWFLVTWYSCVCCTQIDHV